MLGCSPCPALWAYQLYLTRVPWSCVQSHYFNECHINYGCHECTWHQDSRGTNVPHMVNTGVHPLSYIYMCRTYLYTHVAAITVHLFFGRAHVVFMMSSRALVLSAVWALSLQKLSLLVAFSLSLHQKPSHLSYVCPLIQENATNVWKHETIAWVHKLN